MTGDDTGGKTRDKCTATACTTMRNDPQDNGTDDAFTSYSRHRKMSSNDVIKHSKQNDVKVWGFLVTVSIFILKVSVSNRWIWLLLWPDYCQKNFQHFVHTEIGSGIFYWIQVNALKPSHSNRSVFVTFMLPSQQETTQDGGLSLISENLSGTTNISLSDIQILQTTNKFFLKSISSNLFTNSNSFCKYNYPPRQG